MLVLAGSLLGFLPFNFPPASILLGRTGSMFLGFALASVALLGSHKSQATMVLLTPLLVLGLPIGEMAATMFQRLLRGRPLFAGDTWRAYHRLHHRGLTGRRTIFMLSGTALIMTLAAILNDTVSKDSGLAVVPYATYALAALAIALTAAVYSFAGHLLARLCTART